MHCRAGLFLQHHAALTHTAHTLVPLHPHAQAKQYVECGADALVVSCDSDHSPSGLVDLFNVTQAVKVRGHASPGYSALLSQ